MPEGHSVHRLADGLHRTFAGQGLATSSPQGRFTSGAELLDGVVLCGADAWGKHLFLEFERDLILHVHLGLYGSFLTSAIPVDEPRGAVRLRLVGSKSYADLRGPTACDLVGVEGRAAILARLGPDPLRSDAEPERVTRRILSSRAPIGTLLMDQAVIAGIGNIYRAELLFRHGISPFTEGRAVPGGVVEAMWDDISVLMRDGVRRGRIVTVEPHDVARLADLDTDRPSSDDPDLDGGEDTPSLRRRRRDTGSYVYRREGRPCVRCATPISMREVSGRRVYWCPGCQI